MTPKRLRLAWIAVALILSVELFFGHQRPPLPTPPGPPAAAPATLSGGDFLPFYYDILTGRTALGDDECPPAEDLHTLLIPCDTPNMP